MKRVFITGASSGIGKALALGYAKQKGIIGICARRKTLLEEVATVCRRYGADIHLYNLDVRNSNDCKNVAKEFITKANGIDCVIANAGIGGDDKLYSGSSDGINKILDTNIKGVTNTLMPFIPTMKEQKYGSLVCVSSVASFFPLPFHGGYSGSKIGIRMILDSWRPSLSKYNIEATTICPGYVDTPMVKKAIFLPLKPVDASAKKFIMAIERGEKTFIYPKYYKLLIYVYKIIPKRMYDFLIKKLFNRPIV